MSDKVDALLRDERASTDLYWILAPRLDTATLGKLCTLCRSTRDWRRLESRAVKLQLHDPVLKRREAPWPYVTFDTRAALLETGRRDGRALVSGPLLTVCGKRRQLKLGPVLTTTYTACVERTVEDLAAAAKSAAEQATEAAFGDEAETLGVDEVVQRSVDAANAVLLAEGNSGPKTKWVEEERTEVIPFGSGVDADKSSVTIESINAETGRCEEVLLPEAYLYNRAEMPQFKFYIKKLSSDVNPRAAFKVRVTVRIALHSQPGKPRQAYVAESEPLDVISSIPNAGSKQRSHARKRGRA